MNAHQRTALEHHCRLAAECVHPQFFWWRRHGTISIGLTVNSGYE